MKSIPPEVEVVDLGDNTLLGMTPIDFVREINFDDLENAESISLRILKEGYFEQTKSWLSDDFI
ncbi:MAG: hypothetical protein U9N73_06150, partial [Candidatus Auribacterota bacterium]|nr:hypothetical protein [Candidatus Auribacterota bacterium]